MPIRSSASSRWAFLERLGAENLDEFVEQFARERGEIVYEVQRILDLVRDAGGELAERGQLFRLHQPVLRLAQVVERGRQLSRARLHLVEQTYVLQRDHRLIGEGLDHLDLALGETPGSARDNMIAPSTPSFPQQGHAEQRTHIRRQRAHRDDIFGISEAIGNALDLAREQDPPAMVARPGTAGWLLRYWASALGMLRADRVAIAVHVAVANADRAGIAPQSWTAE